MSEGTKTRKPIFRDIGKILRGIKLLFMPVAKLNEFPTLEDFFPQLGISGVNSLSSKNIKILIASFDQHLLLEKGMFVLLDKFQMNEFQDVGKVDENDELRIIGLLICGQWLVIKIYPNKITKFPSKDIELRDCFDIIRIGADALSEKDCSDILFRRGNEEKIIAMFYQQIDGIVKQKEKDLDALQEFREQMRNILIKT